MARHIIEEEAAMARFTERRSRSETRPRVRLAWRAVLVALGLGLAASPAVEAATYGSNCSCHVVWNGNGWTSHYHCKGIDGTVTCYGSCP